MLKLKISQIIKKIEAGECFECISSDGSFLLSIDEYVPYICCAIHDGGNFRAELKDKLLLTKQERWYEEDPHTGDFISSLPIRLIANDSRYEYDLNRPPETCIYKEAWGKQVWSKPLSKKEEAKSLEKHSSFYRVLDTLVTSLEKRHGASIVYDIHSYNYKRIKNVVPPLFNIGSVNLNKKHKIFVKDWIENLSQIQLDSIDCEVAENRVFKGHGYLLKHITNKFENSLVLATEIKKVYCDEDSGDIFPEVISQLKFGLKKAIIQNARFYIEKQTNYLAKKRNRLLASKIDAATSFVDEKLAAYLKEFDVLEYVNPTNLESEKKKFFQSNFTKNPEFKYKPLKLDAGAFKRKLYNLPVDEIGDIGLQGLYRDIIESYADQAQLLSARGTKDFLYISLKYFGEPSLEDIKVADFILSCPDVESEVSEKSSLDAKKAMKVLDKMIKHYHFSGGVELVKNIPTHAVFSPSRRMVRVRENSHFTPSYANALAHHEVGVHMLTTENAELQPLKILQSGMPLDTLTQEGLAILSEYLSGFLSIQRLKELGFRVKAVRHMIKNYSFKDTFLYLVENHKMSPDRAFYLCTRVYRGGGFTKDYVYLKGFQIIKSMYEEGKDLSNLLVGKTSYDYLALINELVHRKILEPPKYKTLAFTQPNQNRNEILDYLLKGI